MFNVLSWLVFSKLDFMVFIVSSLVEASELYFIVASVDLRFSDFIVFFIGTFWKIY